MTTKRRKSLVALGMVARAPVLTLARLAEVRVLWHGGLVAVQRFGGGVVLRGGVGVGGGVEALLVTPAVFGVDGAHAGGDLACGGGLVGVGGGEVVALAGFAVGVLCEG